MKQKRGSLSLSVNAIVMFVLAFALLGVGLYFTNYIKEKMTTGTMGALDINELSNPPSADTPITIPSTVNVKYKKQNEDVQVGVYNNGKFGGTYDNAKLKITKCVNSEDVDVTTNLPIIASTSESIEIGGAAAYKAILTEKGLTAGTYVCKLSVVSEDDSDNTIYDSKSFRLRVTS